MKPAEIKSSRQVRSIKNTIYSNGEPYKKLENLEEGSGENETISKMTEQEKDGRSNTNSVECCENILQPHDLGKHPHLIFLESI